MAGCTRWPMANDKRARKGFSFTDALFLCSLDPIVGQLVHMNRARVHLKGEAKNDGLPLTVTLTLSATGSRA